MLALSIRSVPRLSPAAPSSVSKERRSRRAGVLDRGCRQSHSEADFLRVAEVLFDRKTTTIELHYLGGRCRSEARCQAPRFLLRLPSRCRALNHLSGRPDSLRTNPRMMKAREMNIATSRTFDGAGRSEIRHPLWSAASTGLRLQGSTNRAISGNEKGALIMTKSATGAYFVPPKTLCAR
jgi:hypothetical protein